MKLKFPPPLWMQSPGCAGPAAVEVAVGGEVDAGAVVGVAEHTDDLGAVGTCAVGDKVDKSAAGCVVAVEVIAGLGGRSLAEGLVAQ